MQNSFALAPAVSRVRRFVISWDVKRLDNDFSRLYSILRTARWDAFFKETTVIVRFNGATAAVTDQKD
jgi:hypothetical protein